VTNKSKIASIGGLLIEKTFVPGKTQSIMSTSHITSDTTAESTVSQIFQLLFSVMFAFAGFSLAFIVVLSFGFVRILYSKIEDGTLTEDLSLMDAFFQGGMLAVIYGLLFLIALAVPFFIIAIPAALIVWKFKIIRWWVCMAGGGGICAIPIAIMLIPIALGTLGRLFFGENPRFWNDMFDIFGMFLGAVFCGTTTGLCFWLTLRLLSFPNMNGPIVSQTQLSK
jgi:hypothetical protein